MWERIRKLVLTCGFVSAIVLILILSERDFDNPKDWILMLFSMAYMVWFTAGNRGTGKPTRIYKFERRDEK